jgi:hypothetical protein
VNSNGTNVPYETGLILTRMGKPDSGIITQNATQTDFSYTSTRSTFVFDVAEGKIELTAEFLSPVGLYEECGT